MVVIRDWGVGPGDVLVKEYKLAVIKVRINSGDLIYSAMTVVNNIVLYT